MAHPSFPTPQVSFPGYAPLFLLLLLPFSLSLPPLRNALALFIAYPRVLTMAVIAYPRVPTMAVHHKENGRIPTPPENPPRTAQLPPVHTQTSR